MLMGAHLLPNVIIGGVTMKASLHKLQQQFDEEHMTQIKAEGP